MKKILLICLLSVTLFSQTVYTKNNTEITNGITISIETKKPINGIMKTYYLNLEDMFDPNTAANTGELKAEMTYEDGQMNGILQRYYKTGKLKLETTVKDGKSIGIVKIYFKTGELKGKISFKNGKAIQGFKYTQDGKKIKMTNAHFHNLGLKY